MAHRPSISHSVSTLVQEDVDSSQYIQPRVYAPRRSSSLASTAIDSSRRPSFATGYRDDYEKSEDDNKYASSSKLPTAKQNLAKDDESLSDATSSSHASDVSLPITPPAELADKASVESLEHLNPPSDRKEKRFTGVWYTIRTIVKVLFATSLVVALIVGYAMGISVLNLHVTTVGMYGVILMADFVTQYSCAIANRIDVNRITNKSKRASAERERILQQQQAITEKPEAASPFASSQDSVATPPVRSTGLMNPEVEISIAVVGYREEENAWKQCIASLQKQQLPPKCVVGVVDGNEQPDLDMANNFMEAYSEYNSRMIHLPKLLSAMHRETYFETLASLEDTRGKYRRWYDRFRGHYTENQEIAMKAALDVVLKQVAEWEEEFHISSYEAVCFSQPHGHKRTAMFTAFCMSLYAIKTKHAVFTTDSDTLVKDDALDEMYTLLKSSPNIGGVTADVKIWNRADSFLARLCSVRYWFAFNIERACQSWWHCVSCLSGPMSLYRSSDLHAILGLWNLQTFRGKDTTFGDDRHLSNQILAQGLNTRYTHRTWCESESPTAFVRWVKQQTRWSKSFFREAFWFPHSFAMQSWWLLVETSKQTMYPFILVSTVFHLLFGHSDNPFRPVVWLVTMFGVALVKSCMAVIITRDPWLLLFSGYGFVYFFGLLPSKIWALFTMNKTTWGTSARSASEMKVFKVDYRAEFFHVGHLVFWYTATSTALAFFLSSLLGNWVFMPLAAVGLLPSVALFHPIPSPMAPIRFLRAKISTRAKVPAVVIEEKTEVHVDPDHTSAPPPATEQEKSAAVGAFWASYSVQPTAALYSPDGLDAPDPLEVTVAPEPEEIAPRPIFARSTSSSSKASSDEGPMGEEAPDLDLTMPLPATLALGRRTSRSGSFSARGRSGSVSGWMQRSGLETTSRPVEEAEAEDEDEEYVAPSHLSPFNPAPQQLRQDSFATLVDGPSRQNSFSTLLDGRDRAPSFGSITPSRQGSYASNRSGSVDGSDATLTEPRIRSGSIAAMRRQSSRASSVTTLVDRPIGRQRSGSIARVSSPLSPSPRFKSTALYTPTNMTPFARKASLLGSEKPIFGGEETVDPFDASTPTSTSSAETTPPAPAGLELAQSTSKIDPFATSFGDKLASYPMTVGKEAVSANMKTRKTARLANELKNMPIALDYPLTVKDTLKDPNPSPLPSETVDYPTHVGKEATTSYPTTVGKSARHSPSRLPRPVGRRSALAGEGIPPVPALPQGF